MNLTVNSIEELKFIASDDPQDFFILLNHNLHASKRIFYDDTLDLFSVEDFVTSTENTYSIKQLKEDTNIVRAIDNGAFFLETTREEAANIRTSMALSIGGKNA